MLTFAQLADLGRSLAAAGLTSRGLALWSGTQTLARLPAIFAASPPPNRAPAAFALELFVAGRPAPFAEAKARLGAALPSLLDARFLDERDGQVIPRRALLPLAAASPRRGEATLAVCDRWDAPPSPLSTPWPDDSSHHLCGALGGLAALRPARWLDLGTGSAIAPLCHRALAAFTLGTDLILPTARAAQLGAALSDHRRLFVAAGDLDDAVAGTWDLLTCNAPIPDVPVAPDDDDAPKRPPLPLDTPRWRRAEADFLVRLCQRIPSRLARDGLAVLHARHDALERALATLGGDDQLGEVISVVYTPARLPPGAAPFSITWWQPHLPARRVAAHRALTAERPHLDERDRDDARNNRLPSLPAASAS